MPTASPNPSKGGEQENPIEEQIERLFHEASIIEAWMKAHWNQDGTDAYREQRRRYLAIMDEINMLLDNQTSASASLSDRQ